MSAIVAMAQVVSHAPASAQRSSTWQGTLTLASRATLRVVLHLRIDERGVISGSLDSLDQRVWNTPLTDVTRTATTLSFVVPANGSRYSAKWDAIARCWVGTWSQGTAQIPLTLAPGGPPPRPARSPAEWAVPTDFEIGDILARRLAQRPGEAIVVGVIDPRGRRIVVRGPANSRTLFEIGSITKIFTGLLLADMAARGEVGLNDPLSKYLPAAATPKVRGREITLLDLATHRSGLPRVPLNLPRTDEGNPYADYTPALMEQFLGAYVPDREPGARYEYSNLGVALLGQILAKRAGTEYETLVRTRITGPLKLADTQIRHSGGDMRHQAIPHDAFLRPVAPWDDSVMRPAGGLRSDADDMLTFLAAHLGFTPTPLKTAMDAMRVAQGDGGDPDTAMGIGWMIAKTPIGEIVTHGGATGGYLTRIAFDPVRRRGVVVLANAMAQPGVDDIALHLLTGSPIAVAPPPPAAPAARPVLAIPPADLDKLVGRYRLDPDQVITVFRSKNRLMIQLTGQQALPVHASGPLDFFGTIVPFELRFYGSGGKIEGLRLRQDGEEKTAPRITTP
ncbi:serine hydrolase domain-containing protein [Sphingomonas sp. MMS12-HWE2-04]|uniref:serine hydrolase domain-containing protein n=1 Tax=Sphingomonas sp. MMS12-HWE2-04 TaxID=3234199 RepID=UPI00385079BE